MTFMHEVAKSHTQKFRSGPVKHYHLTTQNVLKLDVSRGIDQELRERK